MRSMLSRMRSMRLRTTINKQRKALDPHWSFQQDLVVLVIPGHRWREILGWNGWRSTIQVKPSVCPLLCVLGLQVLVFHNFIGESHSKHQRPTVLPPCHSKPYRDESHNRRLSVLLQPKMFDEWASTIHMEARGGPCT